MNSRNFKILLGGKKIRRPSNPPDDDPVVPRSRVDGCNLTASARQNVPPPEKKRSKRRDEDEAMDGDDAVDRRKLKSTERRSKLVHDRPLEPSDEDEAVDEDEDLGQDAGDRHLMDEDDEGDTAAQADERARKGKGKKKKKKTVDDSWKLTGAMLAGGPMIPELIPSFGGHVAVDVWERKERGVLKIYTRGGHLKHCTGFDPATEVEEYHALQATGLAHLHEMTYRSADSALISAFVERWQPDTNTFHMPFGEMTITLHDVLYMMGLPINGKVCVPTTKADTAVKMANMLALLPHELSELDFKETLPHELSQELFHDGRLPTHSRHLSQPSQHNDIHNYHPLAHHNIP
ncbi:hypothetical protein CASFOL_009189 [Castilleja foliolosa]|uniref:Aminotransferase-like plant mobile domain-containing protein n=1 Tax=Castilleja foliolosa TaxID=1961234 RepID=A0ABD3E0J6_9LAMI